MLFPKVPVRVPFSKSTVFKICRQKMCRFRENGRPIRLIFHRFQNVPASCERSLNRATNSKFLAALKREDSLFSIMLKSKKLTEKNLPC